LRKEVGLFYKQIAKAATTEPNECSLFIKASTDGIIDLIFPFLASGMLDDEKVIRKTPTVTRHDLQAIYREK
jgi:hypothetical protein